MEFKDDEIKRLQLAAEAEEKKRFLKNARIINESLGEPEEKVTSEEEAAPLSQPQNPSLRQIRTFQGDVASALQTQKESLASIQKQEEIKRKEKEVKNVETHSNKSVWAMLIGIIVLILLGAGGGYFAYQKFKSEPAPVVITAPENRFLPIKKEQGLNVANLTRDDVIQRIRTEMVTLNPQEGEGVVQLQLRKGSGEAAPILSTSEFFILLETQTPPSLVRAFNKLFMFGFLIRNTVKPFILIKLDSFEQTYPGMLEWEKNMREDIVPLFINNPSLVIPSDKEFEDLTISNKDSRVLRDNEGKTVLIYTYIDNEYLLITDTEETLKSLLGLISASKLSR